MFARVAPWRPAWTLVIFLSEAAAAGAAPSADRHAVAGLSQPARIVTDRWGISHIYARSARDAYFLQGYNAARDRLWQIDLWRKRGLGRLARSLGPDYVDQDRAARLLLYRGGMAREWAAYGPGARAIAAAFVAGINSYVAEVRQGTRPLPPEFRLTGSVPEPWAAEDVVRIRSHGLVDNVRSEVERARVLCQADLSADELRGTLEPAHTVEVPPGLDPCDVPADVLRDYELGTAPVRFSTPGVTARAEPDSAGPGGSNAWVIAPGHSATGRPILANDPHRALTMPSLRYLVHLEAPGLSVIGAGEPALPGIALGHNAHAAFGLTIFAVDQEDLYVYELDPADPDRYRYRDGWERMTVVHESIEVKGRPPVPVELRFTRHGPVLKSDPAKHRGFALRSVWSEPGTSPYFASIAFVQVREWSAFRSVRDRWGAPPLNLMYADDRGNVGWAPGARGPERPNWDGLLPVPGDGRYEWREPSRRERLPTQFNPPRGWFATANEMNLPADYLANHAPTSFEWANRSRIERIDAVLESKPKLSLLDSMALQNDTHDPLAARAIGLLPSAPVSDPGLRHVVDLLRAWDLDETPQSTAATIYQTWVNRHLGPMTVARLAPGPVHALIAEGSLTAVIQCLEQPDARLGSDPRSARDDIVLQSLGAAVAELTKQLGPDVNQWQWGRVHTMTFRAAVAPLAGAAAAERFVLPSVAVGGSGNSPKAAGFDPANFAVAAGASVRLVMDVGDWDRSRAINAPGQSGNPGDPHYADLLASWAAGDYVPLLFSRGAIEREAETITVMVPARGQDAAGGPAYAAGAESRNVGDRPVRGAGGDARLARRGPRTCAKVPVSHVAAPRRPELGRTNHRWRSAPISGS